MIYKLKKYQCEHLLNENYIGHLGYLYNNKPYVVPITYFYNNLTNSITGYSCEGHKINALRINNNVSFEVAEINSVNNWKSVVIEGAYHEFEGSTAKRQLHRFYEGVKHLIKQKENLALNFISDFSSKIHKEGLPIVFEIRIQNISGRERSL